MTTVGGGNHTAQQQVAAGASGERHGGPLSRVALSGRSVASLLGLLSLLTVAAAGFIGCARPEREDGYVVDVEADSVRIHGAAQDATTAPDGRKYEFRAVCIESKHPGGMIVLSKWVDDLTVVRDLGQYHGDHKAKGHRWRIERRISRQAGP